MLRLEPRESPAVDVGGGEVWLSGRAVRVFEDWNGPLSVYDGGGRTWVGAGPGGGPRVAVLDAATGDRDRPDYWAGDPASRAGVVFVAPDRPDPVYVPGVPALAAGDPAGFPLFLDFEGNSAEAWVREAFAAAARLLAPAGLHLTTARPDAPAGTYGTAVVGAPLAFHGGPVAGLAPSDRWDYPPSDPYRPRSVFVSPLAAAARAAGVAAAHEVGHAFGLAHRDGRTVMSAALAGPEADWHPDDLTLLRSGVAAARSQRPPSTG